MSETFGNRERALDILDGSLGTAMYELKSRLTGNEWFNKRPITWAELRALFVGLRELFDSLETVLFKDSPIAIPASPVDPAKEDKEKVDA